MKHTPWISLLLVTFGCFIPLSTQAQVSPDGTTTTTVNQNGNDFTIEQGDRVGDNLFHSFDEFSVPTLGSAVFNNPGDIANIFSRVTGTSISNIDGILGANSAANLYLINPNGIVFGENASLNLGGSFFASTADSLLFEGDTEFSAVDPEAAPLLEVSIPIGAKFRDNPGDINNLSFVLNDAGDENIGLEVLPGKNIILLGGNLNFEIGQATARGGNIYLGGLAEAGIVNINEDGSLSFPENLTLANISLTNAADIDVTGMGGGNVVVNAQNLSLAAGEFGSSLIRAGIRSESNNPEAQAGNITFNVAENITLNNSRIVNQVDPEGVGNSGDITINTNFFEVINGGLVDTSTFGQGNAGAVNVTAARDITVDGKNSSGISSVSDLDAVGDAGGVTIITTNLNLTNGGNVIADTFGQGDAGFINITATGDITIDGEQSVGLPSIISTSVSDLDAVGDAGGVTISTNNLNITNGGLVDASSFGQGDAGFINITATGDITIDGEQSKSSDSGSGVISQVDSSAVGDAGGVTISTNNLNITNGGLVGASSFGQGDAGFINITATGDINIDGEQSMNFPSSITSGVDSGKGNAGGVNISTNNLNLTNGGRVSVSTAGQGDAGFINITATGNITIDGESSVGIPSGIRSRVVPGVVGNAGGITISTNNLNLTNGGGVDAGTFGQGDANNVNIDATNSIFISGATGSFRSGISSKALENDGDGGDINVFTKQLTIENGGTIEAGNFDNIGDFEPGTGQPGNINIEVDSLDLNNGGTIEAATQFAQSTEVGSANINIASEDITLDNNALISARAFEDADGGNLSIDTGFILAFPNGNNDIVARAEQGNGGRINIDTEAIFGLEERVSEPANLTNDIDASSEFGLQGDFSLNTPDFDPTTGLINLPASVGDASDQISQNPCQQGVGSEFIVTGKGGLPPSPTETIGSNQVEVDLVEPLEETGGQGDKETRGKREDTVTETVPAMGWVFNDKGEVTLTAYSNTDTEIERSHSTKTTCNSNNPNQSKQ